MRTDLTKSEVMHWFRFDYSKTVRTLTESELIEIMICCCDRKLILESFIFEALGKYEDEISSRSKFEETKKQILTEHEDLFKRLADR